MLFLKCKFDPTIFLVFIKTFGFLPFSKRSAIKCKDSAFRSGSLLPLQQHHVPLFPLLFVLNTHGFFPSSKVLPQDLQFYTYPFFRTGTGKLLRREGQIVSILGFVDHRSVLRLLNSAKLKRRTQNLNSLRHTYVNEWGVNTNRKECGCVTVETHLQTQGRASSTWGSWVADPWPRRMPVTLHVLTFSSEKCGHCTYNIILS